MLTLDRKAVDVADHERDIAVPRAPYIGLIRCRRLSFDVQDRVSTPGVRQQCVVCGQGSRTRSAVRLASGALIECESCGTWTSVPRPSVQEQIALHDSTVYFEHPYFSERREALTASLRRAHAALDRIGHVLDPSTLRGQRHLDVGCDTGTFLLAMSRLAETQPIGIDVASLAVAQARAQGIEVYHGSIEDAPSSESDLALITAIDLIEHVVDPGQFLAQAHSRMRPGGVLYLETPNPRSVIYRLGSVLNREMRSKPLPMFERLFPAEHIQYFTRQGLARLAAAHGFEVAWIGTRTLPPADIATSSVLRLGLTLLQVLDYLTREKVLLCAVLRRPLDADD